MGFFSTRRPVAIRDIEHGHELRNLLRESERRPVLLYKHSAICGLSSIAEREIRRLSQGSDVPVYRIVVQKARRLSAIVERFFGIRHESPQAILVFQRRAIFDASHRGVRSETLEHAARRFGDAS
jgi:bacillithiol system protein YtxJ